MTDKVLLRFSSVLLVALLLLHVADDIVRGIERGGVANLAIIPICSLWLYASLVLHDRRVGIVIMLLGAVLALSIPVVHMQGVGIGVGSRFAGSGGHLVSVITMLALGVVALFSTPLALRALRPDADEAVTTS